LAVVVRLSQGETDAIAAHLGQSKLEKRQAELILQHAGLELIEATLERGVTPDEVEVTTTASSRGEDLSRWRVGR
jgi:hypothetical protein